MQQQQHMPGKQICGQSVIMGIQRPRFDHIRKVLRKPKDIEWGYFWNHCQNHKRHSLGNTNVWVMQIHYQGFIFTQRPQVISNALMVNYIPQEASAPQKISALGTARQARPFLAVTSSGPRLHLDSKSALDLAILTSCPNERIGTNLLEEGQQTSTMLHTPNGFPASCLPSLS